jgi:hypothetical protein
MSSPFSGSIIGSHTKSTIFVTRTAGLDSAAGFVRYIGSRKLSENEILNYIIRREEKKKERQIADGFPTHLGRQERVIINSEY